MARHVGYIGISVHDDFKRRVVGSAPMAALINVADNWLDLKRLELTLYVDNAPPIRLYQKFGFEVEGTLAAVRSAPGNMSTHGATAPRTAPEWGSE